MNRIKELRQAHGWKQLDLASRLGVRQQAISKYENGSLDIDTNTIRCLCEIFGVTADYLLGLSTQRSAQISEEDAALVAAYHAAPAEIRAIVDTALDPYAQKKIPAVG